MHVYASRVPDALMPKGVFGLMRVLVIEPGSLQQAKVLLTTGLTLQPQIPLLKFNFLQLISQKCLVSVTLVCCYFRLEVENKISECDTELSIRGLQTGRLCSWLGATLAESGCCLRS